jgi:signal transduction histidine kinase
MKKPAYPKDEAERQREVEKYQLLDTLPEESYDTITALMAYICDVPISLVSILDRERNFLKSHHGIPFNEDPRDRSFCGHAILSDDEIMIVADASLDERFHDNPLVSEMGVRFYAGAPLINPDGYRLGTLCVFDLKPKVLTEHQVKALVDMSKHVMLLMEKHYININLMKAQGELNQRYKDLQKFAAMVSHDLKSPLARITGLADLLTHSLDGKIDEETTQCIQLIKKSSDSLANYIDGILRFYNSEELLKSGNKETNTKDLFKEIEGVFSAEPDLAIHVKCELDTIQVNSGVLMQILLNLITNGIKYNAKEKRLINVRLAQEREGYKFEVKDNGDGIESKDIVKVFELFETTNKVDRFGRKGTGIGLATVKKLIQNLRGEIWIESTPSIGTIVHFIIPK